MLPVALPPEHSTGDAPLPAGACAGPAGQSNRDERRDLLVGSVAVGVDVEGGWECRNGEASPDWDVVVTEMQKPPSSE